ncbi:unnamed protein product [Symbiodinium sp. CCMP2592]|nr:unnamed protein product [Symbiodinium sp. CCMP2592]
MRTAAPAEEEGTEVRGRAPELGRAGDVTLVLKNISKKMSRDQVLMLCQDFKHDIDYCHMPMDTKRQNAGYVFMNFRTCTAADAFKDKYNGSCARKWFPKRDAWRMSDKGPSLVVIPASIQGLKANLQHAERKKLRRSSLEGFLPVSSISLMDALGEAIDALKDLSIKLKSWQVCDLSNEEQHSASTDGSVSRYALSQCATDAKQLKEDPHREKEKVLAQLRSLHQRDDISEPPCHREDEERQPNLASGSGLTLLENRDGGQIKRRKKGRNGSHKKGQTQK